jgi:hypothetical protein
MCVCVCACVCPVQCWEELIEHSRESCDHFNHFYCSVRADLKDSAGGTETLREPTTLLKVVTRSTFITQLGLFITAPPAPDRNVTLVTEV